MAKVSGSYESVVRGVSQQVAQDRRSGQHAEQVNMIADPVRGLARRHGSLMLDESNLGFAVDFDGALADTVRHGVCTFFVGGVEYDLVYRTAPSLLGRTTFAWAFNKATGKFLPITYAGGDSVLDQLVSGGVSAATGVGKYLFLAGNTIVPSATGTDMWNGDNQRRAVAWVRGGAYSRTFKVTLNLVGGGTVVASYKTASASYPQTLDVSDISVYVGGSIDPEYQKKVNDRVYAYNSEVTKWIGTAAADITPENIAQKLVDDLLSKGVSATRVNGTVCITDSRILDVSGDDGGDGSLLHAVGNEVAAPDLVSVVHYAGKVVKVRPKHSDGSDAFYLQAVAKTPGVTGFTEVTWNEAAGYVIQPTTVFVIGTVANGTLYLASSAARLGALTPGDHPTFKANQVGDEVSCPLPRMFGNRLNYLGVFQDRLVIGSGAVLLFSKPGDYFNWFRLSALTVADNDPWEGFALGAEDDTITSSTTYDRNMVLHGKRFWYEINGRQPFTPKSASISTGSAYKDATTAPPVDTGNYTLYAKFSGVAGQEITSLHQVQAGLVQDDPESVEISLQLDDYLSGKPVQIVPFVAPNMVFVRTEAYRNGVYVYGYLDDPGTGRRELDNWSRWSWDARTGHVVGMSANGPDLMVYLLRHNDLGTWIAAERFTLHSGLSDYPYADSLRPYPAASGYLQLTDTAFADAALAFQNSSTYRFLGTTVGLRDSFVPAYTGNSAELWVGIPFSAFVTPTNPYMRDSSGRSMLAGRLTLGRISVAFEDTAAMLVDVTSVNGTWRSVDFSGRILADPTDTIGRQPVVTAALPATIGKEIRECSYTISAKSWLPLTITSIEWIGQFFNNVRRVQ